MIDEPPLVACQPTEIFESDLQRYIEDPDWGFQPKYDGHRILLDYRGEEPRILNRKGKPYGAGPFRVTGGIPDILQGCVLDGEYMPDRSKYIVFDLLKKGSRIGRYAYQDNKLELKRVFSVRLTFLQQVKRSLNNYYGAMKYPVRGVDVYTNYDSSIDTSLLRVNRDGIDGYVLKKRDSPYIPGPSRSWLKYKLVGDIDCVVTDTNIDSKSNCELSVWDSIGERYFPIGRASTAGNRVALNSVVTVRFLKLTDGLRLREPRIVSVRDDKEPLDCTVTQLVPFLSQAVRDNLDTAF